MKRSMQPLTALLAACTLAIVPAAFAANYSLAGGAVTFKAPDEWPMLMEKLSGQRQFVALQIKTPGNPAALARISVTVDRVNDLHGFQEFLDQATARAHKLPGYIAENAAGGSSNLRYTAYENQVKTAFTETFAYRSGLGIRVRCIRPAAAPAAWRTKFDAGCRHVVAATER